MRRTKFYRYGNFVKSLAYDFQTRPCARHLSARNVFHFGMAMEKFPAVAEMVKRLPLDKTSRVLEVGAGSGFYSVEVAKAIPEGKLELVDLQEEMLAKARQKIQSAGLKNVGYTSVNAGERIPLDKAGFDVVFMVTVLGEVENQESLIRETNRLLRKGGTLSVSEHLPDPDFVSSGKLRRLVENNDFRFDQRFGKSWAYTANFEKI
jgi:ubiquinone/menaquinone biosynthesis C-methylase UbiE